MKGPGYTEMADVIEVEKESMTPLGKELKSLIDARGPITLNEFMTQVAHEHVHLRSNQIHECAMLVDYSPSHTI